MSLPRRFLESTEHFHIQHLLPCLYTVRAVDSRARPIPSFLSETTRQSSMSWDTRLTANCLTSAVHRSTSMYKLQVMSITVFPGGRGGGGPPSLLSVTPAQWKPILGERNSEEAHQIRLGHAYFPTANRSLCYSRASTCLVKVQLHHCSCYVLSCLRLSHNFRKTTQGASRASKSESIPSLFVVPPPPPTWGYPGHHLQ